MQGVPGAGARPEEGAGDLRIGHSRSKRAQIGAILVFGQVSDAQGAPRSTWNAQRKVPGRLLG